MNKIIRHKKVLLIIGILSIVSFSIAGISIYLNFKNAQNQLYDRLINIVDREKSAVSIWYTIYHADENQIIEHLHKVRKNNNSIGQNGEIIFVKETTDSIDLLISNKKLNSIQKFTNTISVETPIFLALHGKTGTTQAKDYKNEEVYAAYAYVKELNWGIVAKIPVSEINAPYIQTTWLVFLLTLVLISLSSYLFIFPLFVRIAKNEEKVAQYTDRLEDAEALAGLGSWEFDLKSRKSWWSKHMYLMNGFEVSDTMPDFENYLQHIHSEDRSNVEKTFRHFLQKKSTMSVEFRNNPENGNRCCFQLTIHVETNTEGEAIKYKGIQLDITQRKQAEQNRQRQTDIIQAIMNATLETIILLDDKYTIIATNETFAKRLFMPVHEVIGKNYFDFVPEELTKKRKESLQQVFSTGKPTQMEDIRNGLNLEHHVFPVFEKEKIKYIVTYIRNITERKQAEVAIRASQDLFSKAFHSSPLAIVIARFADGMYLEANENFLQLTELTKEEVIGKNTNAFNLINENEILQIRKLLMERKPLKNYEISAKTKNGKLINVLISIEYIQLGNDDCTITTLLDISDMKKAELSLRESENRFSKIFDSSPIGISLSDLSTGIIINVNNSFAAIWGYSRENLIGRTSIEMNLWTDLADRESMFEELAKNGKIKNKIFASTNIKGEKISIKLSAEEIELSGKKYMLSNVENITELIKIENEIKLLNETLEAKVEKRTTELEKANKELINEIEERKTAEQNLKKSESSLKEAQSIAKMGNWEFDLVTGKNLWSEYNYNIFGLKPYEIEPDSRYFRNSIHPDDLFKIDEVMLQIQNNHKPVDTEMRILLPDNQIKWILGKTVPIFENDKLIKLTGVNIDITQQKEIEEILQRSSTRLELATQAGGVGVWEYDIINSKILWDDQMYALYGIAKENFNGAYETWRAGLHPEDAERGDAEIQEAILGIKEFNTEFRVIWPDKSIHYIRAQAIVQRNSSGKAINMIGTNWDITGQKLSAIALYQAKAAAEDANRMKSEFLANMSHEIRTPLNAIVGFSSILKDKTEGNKTFTEYLNNIIQSSKVLLNLINDILDLSKVEAGRMVIDLQPVNLNMLIKEIQSIFHLKAAEKGINIEIEIAGNIPGSLITDEKYLRQILFNLIGNAVKFTHDGSVEIKVSLVPKNYEGSTIDLVILVKDSGIGIPPDELITIFEPFKQVSQNDKNKYGGTGLGLSITRRLTELLGGTISAESEYGKGSVFCVSFFDVEICALNIDTEINIDKSYLKSIRFKNPLLIMAEDILSNRQVIKGYLELFNIRIIETENGEECINAVRRYQPNIILMDMQMPVMDGFTAINILKKTKEFKNIPIIALTASGMKHEKDRIGLVADEFLLKPVFKYDLLELLAKYLPYEQLPEFSKADSQENNNSTSKILKQELPELLKNELIEHILPEISKLQETLNIDEIKSFVHKLENFEKEQKNTEILNYCILLSDYIQSFNIESISKTLQNLALFINK